MECDICGKSGGVPLHCITCARSAIEVPRIELAHTLISRERIEKHVHAVIQGSEEKSSQHVSLSDSKGGFLVDRYECTKNLDLQRTKAQTAEIEERLGTITDQAALLRRQIEETRKLIEAKRASIAQRKSDLSSITYGIESRRANELDKTQQYVKRLDYKSDKIHRETMEMRVYLCNTAANLAGLKMTRRRTKEGGIKEVYNIGPGSRLRIYDLRELQDAPPDNLSASLGAVALLLVRVAGYLGVRLPAEVTVPYADYPQPTIFRPSSSYQGKKVPFPGTTPSHSSTASPEASRTLETRTPLPKPRTLFLDRPLAHLAVEDHQAYSLFTEGVSLLAYNIAWLCRSQGLKNDFNTWEDVCHMGKNLYRLLVLQETRIQARPDNPLDKDIVAVKTASGALPMRPAVGFGELSHGTSHSFMNMAENVHYLSGWSLTPTKITDDLKAFLLAEQQAQEWDVVNQKEWADMENIIAEDPIVIGEKRKDGAGLDDGRSFLTSTVGRNNIAPQTDDGLEGGKMEERKRGVSGWTKVKSRSDEP
ncbi:UV radiation resistance protein and autophagy-related subunit 14-domain-containing protein [Dendryphion nanum]|uniref:Autophagy-related protein 14 n=1 Tax=Dendryphion nanum TaxID=256645 RepID=A0A9P9DS29_9PLEO|nr:UV radiation resistance protein and autophagy-related subunit 14-domain-containing protein [Dendryphion nanum]